MLKATQQQMYFSTSPSSLYQQTSTLTTLLMAKPLVTYRSVSPNTFSNRSNFHNTYSSCIFSSFDDSNGIYNNMDFSLDLNQFNSAANFGYNCSFGQTKNTEGQAKKVYDTSGHLQVQESFSPFTDSEMLFPFEKFGNSYESFELLS